MLNWLGYLIVGRVLIFLWGRFPLPDKLEQNKFIGALHSCPLCSGVYVYGILAYFLKMSVLSVLDFPYIPFVSELITGGLVSFLVYIFSVGWKTEFETISL